MVVSIPNLLQVERGVWSAGQPAAGDWAGLAATGVRAVVNLRAAAEQPGVDEGAAVRSHGLDYHEFPVSSPADFAPALIRCARLFRLTPFERELLLLVAGTELDRGLRAAITMINGGHAAGATFSLALGVLTQPHWDAMSPDAPLRHWRCLRLRHCRAG